MFYVCPQFPFSLPSYNYVFLILSANILVMDAYMLKETIYYS